MDRNFPVKKIFLKLICAAGVLLLFFAMLSGQLVPASAESYYDPYTNKYMIDTNWWFEDIDVKIDVRRDKTMAITETMRVGFIKGGENTGIIRDIQRVSQTTRIVDGESQKGTQYLAQLSDVNVTINGEPAKVTQSLYNQGQYFSVKMQKSDVSYFPATTQTRQDDGSVIYDESTINTFVLSYIYDLSEDKAKGYDDFTFDVLGYAMDFTKHFTAEITFPEALDKTAVSFRTNRKAEWIPDAEEGESFEVKSNRITIVANPFAEETGYTVQVLFRDGYFETDGVRVFWFYFPFAVAAAVAAVAGIAIFLKYRTKRPVEQIECYPPEGIRIMRYSAIWNGIPRDRDIGAVITHWASQGYVKLYPDGKKNFFVEKVKDLPEDVPFEERNYYNELFTQNLSGTLFSTKQMRTTVNVPYQRKLSRAAEALSKSGEKPALLYPHLTRWHILLTLTGLLPLLMTMIYFCIVNASFLPCFFFIFVFAGTCVGSMQAKNLSSPIIYIFPLMFTALPMTMFGITFYLSLYDYAGLLYLSLGWWLIAFVLLHFLKRRDDLVMRDWGKMLGFKKFLLTAELSRIEMLLDENPEYYANIIPYCLVMGISDKVEKRFAPLKIAAPEWANGIPPHSFRSMSHTLSSSGGSSSGGGGGGHGGSSGGGGGGGGSRGC